MVELESKTNTAKNTSGSSTIIDPIILTGRFVKDDAVSYSEESKQFATYDPKTGLWSTKTDHQIKKAISKFLLDYGKQAECAYRINIKMKDLIYTIFDLAKYVDGPFTKTARVSTLFPVANGVLDLSGAEPVLLPHDSKYGFTHGLPVQYDPEAKCYLFTHVLLAQALSAEDISLFQKYCGSLLTSANELQAMMILKGASKSGKSSTMEIVEKICGTPSVAQLRPDRLGERFETSAYLDKKLVIGTDVSKDFLAHKSAAVLKSLVGGDTIQAELKYRNGRQAIKRNLHVMITTNCELTVPLDNDEDAWKRRLLVIDYRPRTGDSRINEIAKVIWQKESSGILNWFIDGALAHRKDMAKHGEYALTEQQKERVEKIITDSKTMLSSSTLKK